MAFLVKKAMKTMMNGHAFGVCKVHRTEGSQPTIRRFFEILCAKRNKLLGKKQNKVRLIYAYRSAVATFLRPE
jgi:hypothetical protein